MLGHGSGVDELVLLVAAVAGLLIASAVRRRRSQGGRPAAERCPYCDGQLEPDAARCERCGFRAPRGAARPG